MKEMCYDNNEIYLDFAMFMCNSFDEMEKYICGNKERKSVMDDLKNFVLNENLPTYDYGEYIEALHKEVAEEARAEGLAKGLAEGREKGLAEGREKGLEQGQKQGQKQGIIDAALKMIKNGISLEKTSQILEIDINKLKSLTKEQ